MIEYGYALCDIVTAISNRVAILDLPDPIITHLLDRLSTLEHRLSHGASEKLQTGSLVGAFVIARQMMIA